jgi:hypothetical protein
MLAARDLLKATLIDNNLKGDLLVTSILNDEITLKWLSNKADYINAKDKGVDLWFYFRPNKDSEIKLDFKAIQPVVKGTFPPFNEEKIGTLKINKRDDETKRLIIYKGTIEYPDSFLGGTFNIEVDIDYKNKNYSLDHSETYGAMSDEGTAIFNFLESLSIEEGIRASFFDLEQRISERDLNSLKMNELNILKEEIEKMIAKFETTLHTPAQNLKQLELLETTF